MGGMAKYVGGAFPVGHVKLIPQPSSGFHTDPDGSKWLASGAVVAANQADPYLIDTDLRCVKANLDINLPVTLTAAARFAVTPSVSWIIDAAGAVLYSTDGINWNNTTPSGAGIGAITTIFGYRNTGSGVEVFAGSTAALFRALITNAAPQTVAWTNVATISNTSGFPNGSYAYDGSTHVICWPHSSSGSIVALTGTDGISWSEDIRTAANASGGYKVSIAAKPGGGFRVIATNDGSSSCNCYSTANGTSFAKVNTSSFGGQVFAGERLALYVGSRLFVFNYLNSNNNSTDNFYSDDHGVTWSYLQSLHAASKISCYGTGGASWDGTTLSFVVQSSAAGAYIISTTDGINFKSTQLFMSSSEISSFNIGQVIGQRFVFVPPGSSKNKLFNIVNAFTPNLSTDFVGMANRNAQTGTGNLVYGVKIL